MESRRCIVGGRLTPLSNHLDQLEKAVLNYLESSFYKNADKELQRRMRQKGLLPQEQDSKMPEPYRIWQACERHNALWWSGGVSNQPYVMMQEFAACQIAQDTFDRQVANYKRILQDN